MKKNLYTKFLTLVVLFCFPICVGAQDIHYSNFGYSPLNINPALTGVFPGDIRTNAAYRSQWKGVPVSYTTYSGSADFRLGKVRTTKIRHFSVGGLFNYDYAGWSQLTNMNFGLTGAYMLPLSSDFHLSMGLNASFNQRQFKTNDLTWDDQYVDRQFNSNVTSADVAIFNKTHNYMTLAPGFNVHYQKPKKRLSFDIGLGIFNLNRPNISFRDAPEHRLPPRYSFYASVALPVSKSFDILLEGILQSQRPHQEKVGSVGARFYIADKKTSQIALQAGITMRSNDAYSPHFGFLYNQWRVGVNFDTNFSPFKTATNRKGGPEISVIYIFSKVPNADCPLCPTFL